jgi:predicted O-methyltransferase YrrM
MPITEFLNNRGLHPCEGYSQQISKQVEDLINLTNRSSISVMEIGFNGGHSAEIFLKNNSSLNLTSFDLGCYNHVLPAKEYIDATYPSRHTLILGDSTKTLPKYIDENPAKTFDVIFIDGGHEYIVAKSDLENSRKLAHKDTIIVIDDTIYTKGMEAEWTMGPTKTWTEHLENGKIKEINRIEYTQGRGMSWGKYVF